MRAFVALHLDERTRAALARAPVPAAERGGRVRRVAAPNLHLTLKFLGEVDEARIPDVTRALHDASKATQPFELVVRGLGAFPPRGAPRVIWAGCSGGTELETLWRRIEDGLAALGFAPEERGFTPHVTLARVNGHLRTAVAVSDHMFGVVPVSSCSLVESRLGPGGSEYRDVARLPFGGVGEG